MITCLFFTRPTHSRAQAFCQAVLRQHRAEGARQKLLASLQAHVVAKFSNNGAGGADAGNDDGTDLLASLGLDVPPPAQAPVTVPQAASASGAQVPRVRPRSPQASPAKPQVSVLVLFKWGFAGADVSVPQNPDEVSSPAGVAARVARSGSVPAPGAPSPAKGGGARRSLSAASPGPSPA